jgi:hypothetical protein
MRSQLVAALAGAAVAVTVGSIASAAVPDAGGVIHACAKANGDLRVIDTEAGGTCKEGETPLSWSQAGPAGPPGISGYQWVAGDPVEIDPGEHGEAVVQCPSGKNVLSAGAHVSSPATVIVASVALSHDSWFVQAFNESTLVAGSFQASVLCAYVA